ncbi:MAG: MaoC family dehydratase [Paracoccaceae bacterium]
MTRAGKTNPGNFFEDFRIGQVIRHATPRRLTEGDRALYGALYPTRFALGCSDGFARAVGLPRAPLEELIGFHVGFGKTVPDVSLNAVANLGYAECRFLRPLFPDDEISAESEVIGLRQLSNGKAGVVWVRSTAFAGGSPAIEWVRWVMVRKRDSEAPAPETVVPETAEAVAPGDLVVPEGLDYSDLPFEAAGARWRLSDYAVGERIDHGDGVTVEEAEHMMATRLWQNTAKVHFDATLREDGRRLVYGGHVISLARALSFDGLATAQPIAAINGGTHAAPCFAGTTVKAWSEVLDKAEPEAVGRGAPGVGALRLRLVATTAEAAGGPLKGEDGKHAPGVLLDLDLWTLAPA